jgi:DNA recombination protein RmuC
LTAAMDVDPELHAGAMERHVLIATPMLLVALLRAVAYGWRQEKESQNAQAIAAVGRELYERLSAFADRLAGVGKNLTQAKEAYNKAVGSLESRILPSARKLKGLGAIDADEIDAPPLIEIETRPITSDELLRSNTES